VAQTTGEQTNLLRPARRISTLPPYLFAEIDRRIKAKRAAGHDVISLGVGDPDLPTPPHIVEALQQAATVPANHRYPDYDGLPALRQAIANWYEGRFGLSLHPDREVLPLIGSKEGIFHLATAWIDPGDLALVPDPGYPVYATGTLLAGGEVYAMPLRREHGFLPDLDAIPAAVADRARLMWICYPNNPTGAVAELDFYERVVHFARRHGILGCSDNAYSEVAYDGFRPPSLLQAPGAREIGVEFHSLSKSYNMTGWRVGMVVGNERVVEALGRVKTNADSGIFQAVQQAAIVALTGDQSWLGPRNAIYQRRRDQVCDTLAALGIRAERPRASLYVWGEVPGGDSVAWSLRVLDEVAVFITPGVGFGQHGEGFCRISLTTPDDRLTEALHRLRTLVR